MNEASECMEATGALRRRIIAVSAVIGLAAIGLTGCQREAQPPSEASQEAAAPGVTGPVDVRALVPTGYAEPERTWVPPVFTLSIASHVEPRVLVVSGWRAATPFEVRVFANNDLVANRRFEEGLFEMSVDLPPQSGPATTVRIETAPAIGPDQRDLRPRGFVVRSVEVRPQGANSP